MKLLKAFSGNYAESTTYNMLSLPRAVYDNDQAETCWHQTIRTQGNVKCNTSNTMLLDRSKRKSNLRGTVVPWDAKILSST